MINVQTLKGFRDFLPKEAKKRQYVLDALKKVFESYGFEPLETPSLEYEEVLTGKYGQEGEKLMYKFKDNGDRNVALRYDQTVPLARVVAQYQNDLPIPFKRYQMQNVWRADNTQKGRYREFLQVDADIVGSYSPLADIEILQCINSAMNALKFKEFSILVNSRKVFEIFGSTNTNQITQILDKEDKIGKDGVLKLLNQLLASDNEALRIYDMIKNLKPVQIPSGLKEILNKGKELKLNLSPMFFLARGLDYYTDLIFEIKIPNYKGGSVAGGGRYDNLIGVFAGRDIPAVGFSFGFDRLMEAMEELDLLPKDLSKNNVFVAFSNSDLQEKALAITTQLRNKGINAEYYLEDVTLEKQLNDNYCVLIEKLIL